MTKSSDDASPVQGVRWPLLGIRHSRSSRKFVLTEFAEDPFHASCMNEGK